MNKFVKLSVIAAASILAVSSAIASNQLLPILSTQANLSSGAPILYFSFTTPRNALIHLDKAKVLAGSSKIAPCSDLQTIVSTGGGYDATIEPGTQKLSSQDLISAFGAGRTCIALDFTYHGHHYSSGNIRLVDNNKSGYTAAIPSNVSINITG